MSETKRETQFGKVVKYRLDAKERYTKDEPIIITFTLENHSGENLWFLNWYTPFEGLKGKIFHVICDGNELLYQGPMMKRGNPKKGDYTYITSGSSISAEVNLSDVYTFSTSRECRVEFQGGIYDFLKSVDSLPRKSDEHQMMNVTGNSVTFVVV